jgi:hypothetical protein
MAPYKFHTIPRPRPSSGAPAWRQRQGQALRVLRNLDTAGRGRTPANGVSGGQHDGGHDLPMVKAEGTLSVGTIDCPYKFAADPEAGIHLGFASGTLLLLTDPTSGILVQLPKNAVQAGSDIYVTGHSQGAAMATLLRSYFEYSASMPANCSIKTYVFAQPKPGNQHYADDFEDRFCISDMAFRVTNTLDWVSQVPFTLQFIDDIDKPNPLSVVASPSLLIQLLDKALSEVRSFVETHARSRLQSTAVALAQAKAPQQTRTQTLSALSTTPFTVPIMESLNFVNVGTDMPLNGTPCVGDDCHDPLFEHHATTYYPLL